MVTVVPLEPELGVIEMLMRSGPKMSVEGVKSFPVMVRDGKFTL